MNTKKSVLCFLKMCAAVAMLSVSPALAQPAQCYAPPTFTTSPPPPDGGYFSSDMALNGDGMMAIVGEIFGDQNGDQAGTARIFSNAGGPWVEVQTIQHTAPPGSDPLANDFFGSSVDVSGNMAIIAAPGRSSGLGSVYIFKRDQPNGPWSQLQEIVNTGVPGDDFGGSQTRHETVGIDGRLAVVGATQATVGGNGKAYVYFFNATLGTWALEATLTAPTPQAGEQFGYCVDVNGIRVIVGAPYHNIASVAEGAAFVFKRVMSGGTPTWVHEATLTAAVPASFDSFGWSVSIDGNNAIAGAPFNGSGFAAVFLRDTSGVWAQDGPILVPSTLQTGQLYGYAVNVSGTVALVGASNYSSVGKAYLYQRLVSGWSESMQLFSNQGSAGDRVGETLALQGNQVFVGALGDDKPGVPGSQHGSVLIFSNMPTCTY